MVKAIARIPLERVSPGTSRELMLHRYGRPDARPKAYLQAALHADEIPGMLVLHHLIRLLDDAERANGILGHIVVAPVANPIGSGQVLNSTLVGRYEFGSGGNFNRNWPDLADGIAERVGRDLGPDPVRNVALIRAAMVDSLTARQPTSELTSLRLAIAREAVDADIVLDLHCDDESLAHLFLIPAHWPAAADLSAETGSRATLLAEDSGGRSFDETFSTPWVQLARQFGPERPIPPACLAATIEYRGSSDVDDALAAPDAAALFRFLQRRGILAGDAGPLPAPQCDATDLTACDVVRAPAAGIVAYRVPLGARIAKGDIIADLVDPTADDPRNARLPIASATAGLVLSRRLHRLVRPGDSIGKIVGNEPLSHRAGYLLED